MDFYKLKIESINVETLDAISIWFNIPENLRNKFQFKPGQYLTLKERINGHEIRRAYSICSDPNDKLVGVCIKRLAGGAMSTFIHSNWKDEMEVEVSEPQGNFVAHVQADKKRDHYFIAAGSGITPIMSMMKHLLEEEPMSNCNLLYGSRDESNIIFKSQLDEMAQKFNGQFFLKYVLSKPEKKDTKQLWGLIKKPKVTWKGDTGRIGKEKVRKFLEQHPAMGNESQFYLCGPGDLITLVEQLLLDQNVPKANIHKEFFSTAVPSTTHTISNSQHSHIKVNLNGESFTFETDGRKSILDEIIALKKNPPYSCTSGACSSCLAKVNAGKAAMDSNYALDETEVEEGYILTCQARATTQDLEITFE